MPLRGNWTLSISMRCSDQRANRSRGAVDECDLNVEILFQNLRTLAQLRLDPGYVRSHISRGPIRPDRYLALPVDVILGAEQRGVHLDTPAGTIRPQREIA